MAKAVLTRVVGMWHLQSPTIAMLDLPIGWQVGLSRKKLVLRKQGQRLPASSRRMCLSELEVGIHPGSGAGALRHLRVPLAGAVWTAVTWFSPSAGVCAIFWLWGCHVCHPCFKESA